MPVPPEDFTPANFGRCLAFVEQVCDLAGSPDLIEDARSSLARAGVIEAVHRHNDAPLLDWLLEVISWTPPRTAFFT